MKYKIAISLIKGLGPVLARNLVAYLGDAEALFKENKTTLLKIPGIGPAQASRILSSNTIQRAEEEIEFIQKHDISASFFLDDNYPERLRNCNDGPIVLYHRGNHSLQGRKILSVVGTRQITEEGKINTANLIKDIAAKFPEAVIVSGLAYGVDIYAHRAAIEAGLPTLAVLAHGLDRIYPNLHRKEAIELQNNGALVTEFTKNTTPERQNFVKRNRIVAGMADATIVIESAEKGGALITAHLAHSYNRDVLALPGRPGDEFSKGCNKIIKTNVAALIEDANDIAYALNWEIQLEKESIKQLSLFELPKGDLGVIYNILRQEKEASVNLISLKTGFPVGKISSLLLQLEFQSLVKCLPGNIYRCL